MVGLRIVSHGKTYSTAFRNNYSAISPDDVGVTRPFRAITGTSGSWARTLESRNVFVLWIQIRITLSRVGRVAHETLFGDYGFKFSRIPVKLG